MSQVIQDMELNITPKAPYYLLSNALIVGIFSNKSYVTYSNTQINILTRQQIDQCFQLLTKIRIQKSEFSLQSFLMKNGEYFIINSGELRKNMYRSFIKTNYQPKLKILINQQGRVSIKMHTFLTTQLELKHKQIYKIYKYIQRYYKIMIQNFKLTFSKLKLILQPVYQKTIYQKPDKLQRLDIIKNTCRFTYVQPSFMKRDGKRGKNNHQKLIKNFINQDQLGLTGVFQMKVQSDKLTLESKYKLFVQLWQETHNLQKVQDASLYQNFSLVQIKNMLQANLKVFQSNKQITKIQPQEEIFAEIHVLNLEKIQWVKIYEGGFGILLKASVSFLYPKKSQKQKKFSHEKPITKALVMKTDKVNNPKTSRIDIQRLVLRSLHGKKCRYLPKFYETIQKHVDFPNFILTDFYTHKSLQQWLRNYGQITSIFTKFNILIFTCYGLLFLHQNDIIHRDLKTSNILMDSKMVIKITDFGESYHPSLQQYMKSKGRDGKPGLTLPYAAPQIYIKNGSNLLKKPSYDMFSFGFIIFQIIFGRRLLYGMSQAELKKTYIRQAYQTAHEDEYEKLKRIKSLIKQRIYLASQQIAYFGPIQILSPILNIIQRCLDSKAENRPHLQWVLGIIKQVYNSLLDFYSL